MSNTLRTLLRPFRKTWTLSRKWFRDRQRAVGRRLAHFLSKPVYAASVPITDTPLPARHMRPGDVILVDGRSRISAAIKYLTQSTWSHAAIVHSVDGDCVRLIEADVELGVIEVGVEKYLEDNIRICRPVGLQPIDLARVLAHVRARVGHHYDLKNVFDLLRYLLPEPPLPARMRRALITLGSGDPTRAICSTMIASAFQSVNYPILPESVTERDPYTGRVLTRYRQRHHSFFTPRDFDLSPYFAVVKPSLDHAADYRAMDIEPAGAAAAPPG